MSRLKRFTSYEEVEIGQEVFMRWPTEALPSKDGEMPWREGTVVAVRRGSVIVELDNGSKIHCQNLTALHRVTP